MQNGRQLLKIHAHPDLSEPFLIAAGPGTANVGLRTASYLRERLGAELLAEIEPGDFFTPPYSFTFRDGLIDITLIELGEDAPQNRLYYWKSGKAHDIIFFTEEIIAADFTVDANNISSHIRKHLSAKRPRADACNFDNFHPIEWSH